MSRSTPLRRARYNGMSGHRSPAEVTVTTFKMSKRIAEESYLRARPTRTASSTLEENVVTYTVNCVVAVESICTCAVSQQQDFCLARCVCCILPVALPHPRVVSIREGGNRTKEKRGHAQITVDCVRVRGSGRRNGGDEEGASGERDRYVGPMQPEKSAAPSGPRACRYST